MKRFTTHKHLLDLRQSLVRRERTGEASHCIHNGLCMLERVIALDLQEFKEQLLSYIHAHCASFENALKEEGARCKEILENEFDVIRQLDDAVCECYDLEHAMVNEIISEGEFIQVISQYPNLTQAILGQSLESYFRP